jgi:hypothetical protein
MGVRPRGAHDESRAAPEIGSRECRELEPSFRLTLTLLEHSKWLIVQGRAEEGEPLLAAVRETLEGLEAKPWPEHSAQSQRLRRTEAMT